MSKCRIFLITRDRFLALSVSCERTFRCSCFTAQRLLRNSSSASCARSGRPRKTPGSMSASSPSSPAGASASPLGSASQTLLLAWAARHLGCFCWARRLAWRRQRRRGQTLPLRQPPWLQSRIPSSSGRAACCARFCGGQHSRSAQCLNFVTQQHLHTSSPSTTEHTMQWLNGWHVCPLWLLPDVRADSCSTWHVSCGLDCKLRFAPF